MLAVGDRGEMSTDAAIKAPTQKATVVKKPKTFCVRTRLECISANRRWKDYRRPCWCCRGTHDLLDELCMGTYLSYRSGVPDTFQSCKALYNRYFHPFSSPYKMFSEKKPKCLHNQRSQVSLLFLTQISLRTETFEDLCRIQRKHSPNGDPNDHIRSIRRFE